ncbi:uncharacterized protein Z519_00317 [Cladophialophora bantiana CBS 173.52]|uniref:Zn(2)-C6 fungal-type domain-containing protein n=1 Tax=Cladophialophora bantiana (strain ATCC 10958 / CBS 173.52 / CDC B-1940 / NIH 8579) TaxID=1442370 RepID=A0A0D2F992_CLAB1|nr:uncharacterized protein Z519_00317 [Cladophialophora bantiana CBS 173.52]KIW98656.1 hypothetical protein Z519_00317 [Cladophialophora bantiana CBS 173.52]
MAEFSALTNKFRASLDSQQSGGVHKVSKRNRQPVSCFNCRIKKLKCDKGHPCETCVRRGDESSCVYGNIPLPKAADPSIAAGANTSHVVNRRGQAQERLRHLEQLVMQMVGNSTGAQSSHDSESAASPSSAHDHDVSTTSLAKEGHLQYGSSESRYVGSTHWSAILESIQELKSALVSSSDGQGGRPSTTELDECEDVEPQEMDGLFGSTSHISLSQILAQALPPRLQVDRRLSTYFNSRYLVIPFIHTAQFRRQYEQFWRTPLETSPLWVSILFSICCMSATLSEAVGSEPSTPEDQLSPRMSFLNAACQCLRLGGFVRPKRHVVEALGLYAQCKYMATLDPSRDVSIIFPILVRLAYRSGYHRDPSQFPHFSVFEGEMRRRTWAMCRQFDLMVSFQLGLPNLIPPNSWDTLPPSNLLDSDFDEHSTALPPSRPETEATQILYFIVKSRLMTTFGKVCSHALSFRDCSQQEVMDLDREVRAVYATVPEILHIRPMSQSFADPSYLVMVRTNCEFLYQKSLLVLHRKYMTQGTHPTSTEACTDAAMAITRHMLDLHKEFKPGGQLFQDRWMLSSFTMNDFYLAAMVLCLGLSMWKKANPGKELEVAKDDKKMAEQFQLLKAAFGICEELTPTSNEAKRVADVLRVVLGEIGSSETVDRTTGSLGSFGLNTADPRGATPITRQQQMQPPESTALSSKPHPFMQPGRFMGSAMFPMQYDFSLVPLTLQDPQQQQDREGFPDYPSSSTSSHAQQDRNQAGGGGDFFTPAFNNSSITDSNAPLNPNLRLMPGLQNPGLGPNPFMSFLPFSPAAYALPTTANLSSATTMAAGKGTGTTSSGEAAAAAAAAEMSSVPMNMDVDWPFLDQWMALPNPDMLSISMNDNAPPFYNTSPPLPPSAPNPTPQHPMPSRSEVLAEQRDKNDHRDHDTHGPIMAAAEAAAATDWTSTPYRFLGGGGGDTDGSSERRAHQRDETASSADTPMTDANGGVNGVRAAPTTSSGRQFTANATTTSPGQQQYIGY